MSLWELQCVWRKILDMCTQYIWLDMRTGEELLPEDVNLYHFNYHYICPQTVVGYVLITGLDLTGNVDKGQRVVQTDPTSTDVMPLADGVVEEVTASGDITVSVIRGRFRVEAGCSISIAERDCGEPIQVSSPNAISYKELVSDKPLKPAWYCCHWWGEKVGQFVECVEMHSELRDLEDGDATYWICAYANRQHDLGKDICSDPESSSFKRAMRCAGGLLLILDSKATPFRRIWCDYEIYTTISDSSKLLDIVAMDEEHACPRLISEGPLPQETAHQKSLREQQFPIPLLVEGIRRELQNGDSTVQSDKEHILQSMAGAIQDGNDFESALALALKRANNALHAYFAVAAWPLAVKQGSVQNFDEENPGLSLPDVLARDQGLQHIRLSLAHTLAVTDADVAAVASGLPQNLSLLDLSFESSNLTDNGLEILSQRFPHSLRDLFLDLSGCKFVTDAGLEALVIGLPNRLVKLVLNCANCPLISLEGARILAYRLPGSVTSFSGAFRGTQIDCDFSTLDQLRKSQRSWSIFRSVGRMVQSGSRHHSERTSRVSVLRDLNL